MANSNAAGIEAWCGSSYMEVNKVNQTLIIIYLSYYITVTYLLLLKPIQLYILKINYLAMPTRIVTTYRYKDDNATIYPCRHSFIVPLKREPSPRMTPHRHSVFSVSVPLHLAAHQTHHTGFMNVNSVFFCVFFL